MKIKSSYFTYLLLALGCSQIAKESNLDKDSVSAIDEGASKYLVYIENEDGSIRDASIWTRSIEVRDGLVYIKQHWKNQDTAFNKTVYSINREDSFLPVFHKVKSKKGIEAYDFHSSQIVGTDSINNNLRVGFSVDIQKPTLNWELDLETFQLLSYEKNKAFNLHFYHPGSKNPPKDYKYEVIGDELLQLFNRDTWKLKINYSEIQSSTFWIDKETQYVLKMEEFFGKMKRTKILIERS